MSIATPPLPNQLTRPRAATNSPPSAPPASPPRGARTVRVALLGCGTVGSCVARHLLERRDEFRSALGIDLDLQAALVREPARDRGLPRAPGSRPSVQFVDSIDDLLATRPQIVIELLGGREPAARYIRRCLDAGIHVVTANKTVIAHHGAALFALASRRGVHLACEAAVAAAVPILAALRHIEADRVYSIKGIINGSTNYILSRMTACADSSQTTTPATAATRNDNGMSPAMQQAIAEAKQRGFIEPDPSADLSGRDAAEKLAILAAHIGLGDVRVEDIDTRGIESIRLDDILAARRLGCIIRLVAEINTSTASLREASRTASLREAQGDTPHSESGATHTTPCALTVGPALLPRNHRLASVEGADNGIIIQSHFAGELFLLGPGAGPEPTTSAVLGDLVRIVNWEIRDKDTARANANFDNPAAAERAVETEEGSLPPEPPARAGPRRIPAPPRPHFLRVDLTERIAPAAVFDALRQHGVSVKEIDLRPDAVRVLTHPATSAQIRLVVEDLTHHDESAMSHALIAPLILDAPNPAPARSPA